MGFGKSETPQDRRYVIRDHVDNLEGLIDHLAMDDITIVGQDWGGPIGAAYALRHPERIKRLVFMNTGPPGAPPAGVKKVVEHDWYQWIHGDTDTDAVLSNLGSTILSVMKRIGFERTDHVDETWVRAYASPFPTAADCKGALMFPQCIANHETMETMLEHMANLPELAAKPAMYVHGEEDRAIPTDFAVGCFKSTWPNGPVVTLPGVGHFLQEDARRSGRRAHRAVPPDDGLTLAAKAGQLAMAALASRWALGLTPRTRLKAALSAKALP